MYRSTMGGRKISIVRRVRRVLAERGAVLAGGSGLALRLGHRRSADLDFFTASSFDTTMLAYDLSAAAGQVNVISEADSVLLAEVDGVKLSLFRHPYPFVDEVSAFEGIHVAGTLDIASMKIIAICQRGTKRDFFDLHAVLEKIPFHAVATNAVRRFGPERLNPVHMGKSLVYFADAEPAADPARTTRGRVEWIAVKRFYTGHARQFVLDLDAARRE